MGRNNKRKNWKDKKNNNKSAQSSNVIQDGASSPPQKKARSTEGFSSKKGWALANIGVNPLWNQYYQECGIVPQSEFEQFRTSLCEDLPITFRVVRSSPYADLIQELLEKHWVSVLDNIEIDGVKVNPPKQLKWYPHGYGWEYNVSRNQLKKCALLKKFHSFIHILTEQGYICRQEAVSMLPTHYLDVQPHHSVLDMCASPGSKTSQMIESIHSQQAYGKMPEGFVVANDVEQARCYTLVHQILGRLASPAVAVTNHFAQFFPYGEDRQDPAARAIYDRILSDVPCTSDGTLRKSPDLWDKWSPALGLGIHKIQLSITMKGLQLLKEGGIIVYSTCSLNPVEDEAVVAEILRKSNGAVVLEDAKSVLPELKYAQGMNWWRIMDRDGTWYNSHEMMPEARQKRVPPSVFPPYAERPPQPKKHSVTKTTTDENGAEVAQVVEEDVIDDEYKAHLEEFKKTQEQINRDTYHLERCMRILPHYQNTGGFFVAVLRKLRHFDPLKNRESFEGIYSYKKSDFTQTAKTEEKVEEKAEEKAEEEPGKAEEENEITVDEEAAVATEEVTAEPTVNEGSKFVRRTPRATRGGTKEAPFLDLNDSWKPTLASLKDYWGLTDDFPYQNLKVRSEASPNIYYISPKSEEYINASINNTLKLISTGVKAFSKKSFNTPNCEFRVGMDALAFMLPYMTKRKIRLDYPDFELLLKDADIRFDQFSSRAATEFHNLEIGSAILLVKRPTWPRNFPPKAESDATLDIPVGDVAEDQLVAIPVWKGRNTMRLFASKGELTALQLLYCGIDGVADEVLTAQKPEEKKEEEPKAESKDEDIQQE